jgi:hypothetical protein
MPLHFYALETSVERSRPRLRLALFWKFLGARSMNAAKKQKAKG